MKVFITASALLAASAHAAPLYLPKHNEIKDGKPKDLEERQLIEPVVGLGLGAAAITTVGLTASLLDKRDTPASISTSTEIQESKPKDLGTRQLIESVVGLGVGGAIITAAGLTVGLLDKKDIIEAGRQVSGEISADWLEPMGKLLSLSDADETQRRHLANPAPVITTSNIEPKSTNVTLIRYADMSNSHRHPSTGEAQDVCRATWIFHKKKCDKLYPIGQPGWLELDRDHNVASQSGLPVASKCWTLVYQGQTKFCESTSDALYGGNTKNVTSIPHDTVNVPSTTSVKKTGRKARSLRPRHKYPQTYDEQQWCHWGLDWGAFGGDCRIQETIGVPMAYAVDAKGRLVEESHRPAYGTCFAQRNEGYHHYCADLIKHYGSAGAQSGGVQIGKIDLKHGGRPQIQTGMTPSANGTYFASITPTGPGLRSNRPVTVKDGELFTTGNATVVPGRNVWIEPTR